MSDYRTYELYAEGENDWTSRSQRKRESTALQKKGEELAAMGPAAIATLNLPKDLHDAVMEWKKLKTHEAKRRQMQYIGRLMRDLDDLDTVLNAMDEMHGNAKAQDKLLHLAENIRQNLLSNDEHTQSAALAALAKDYPQADMGRIQHIIDGALSSNKKVAVRHSRELLRYIRDTVLQ